MMHPTILHIVVHGARHRLSNAPLHAPNGAVGVELSHFSVNVHSPDLEPAPLRVLSFYQLGE